MGAFRKLFRVLVAVFVAAAGWSSFPLNHVVHAAGNTYYVSTSGDDENDGLSMGTPFKTIAKVNGLILQPGDTVLFKCGDMWRGEKLMITESGTANSPITFGSYPERNCTTKPVISGAYPITGWSAHSTLPSVFEADLDEGENTGKFPDGLNQLFRDGTRLGIGREPDIDAGNGGYTEITAQTALDTFTFNDANNFEWEGATVHIRSGRSYLINREIDNEAGSGSGTTVTVNELLNCLGDDCTGWGIWIDGHLKTLDQEGEWYYDWVDNKVFLVSKGGDPSGSLIEGSSMLYAEGAYAGGIMLGEQFGQYVAYVLVDNFEVSKWFDSGISFPANLDGYEHYQVTLKNNLIQDVDKVGIRLVSYLWNSMYGGPGWRGGRYMTITGNTIERANSRGIDMYSWNSTVENNVIRDVGVIANLGTSGMGCGIADYVNSCTDDGIGIRVKVGAQDVYGFTGNTNTIQYNRLENIAYHGLDISGYANTVYRNVIDTPCAFKGDCAGVHSYGNDNLSTTPLFDLTVRENFILDSYGNRDGSPAAFYTLMGYGLFFDNGSRNVVSQGNVISGSTATGVLYQRSTGAVTNNILFDNTKNNFYGSQLRVTGTGADLSTLTGNTILGKHPVSYTLGFDAVSNLGTSDNNGFYHASQAAHILTDATAQSLGQWQAVSGKDIHSVERVDPVMEVAYLFYNDTKIVQTVYLWGPYNDLAGNISPMVFTLQPFTAKIMTPGGLPTPNLVISKSAPSNVEEDQDIEYTLTVSNKGGEDAINVVVSDMLPEGTTYISGGSLNGNAVEWTIPSLVAGGVMEYTFTVSVDEEVRTIRNRIYSVRGQYYDADEVTVLDLDPVFGVPVTTFVDANSVFLPLLQR